ncbi:MAG: hypothetical protein ACLQOO_33005 [Terriglobia bacterium]
MSSDRAAVYIEISISCSSNTINRLVANGDASFILHVECSNTLFRHAYQFRDTTHRVQIPADNLNDAVEVNVFTTAERDVPAYRVEMAHSDYGDAQFEVEKGDILAVGEGHIFYVESRFDSLSRVGSIMQITESTQDGDLPMRFDANSDKILVVLSKRDFADYKLLKAMEGVSGPLTTAIVLPVLIEAIRISREEAEDSRRWVRALRRRVDSMGLKLDAEPLELAQLILELPVRRTLASARMVVEGGS